MNFEGLCLLPAQTGWPVDFERAELKQLLQVVTEARISVRAASQDLSIRASGPCPTAPRPSKSSFKTLQIRRPRHLKVDFLCYCYCYYYYYLFYGPELGSAKGQQRVNNARVPIASLHE